MTSFQKTKRRAVLCLASLFLFALFLKNSTVAIRAMSKGLRLCVHTVIPSLFPCMVASDLLVAGGGAERFGRLLRRPFRALFGIRGEAACAVLLGMLCGFPIGTRCALALYQNHRLTEDEFSRVLAFSNHPSSAFLISTVGLSLFGSARTGLLFYLTTLFSAVLIQLVFPRKKEPRPERENSPPSEAIPSVASALSGAVSGSALALIPICAFIVFFSTVVESLSYLCRGLSLPETVSALLFGIFELTSGAARAADAPANVAPYLCAFAVGWGGLSVHFQMLHLVGDVPFSKKTYFGIKLAQAFLNVLLLAFLLRIVA